MTKEIQGFPEPMFKSWLGVILWYWTGDSSLVPDGALKEALRYSTHPEWAKPTPPEPTPGDPSEDRFLEYVKDLHASKDAAYGDSWMKRGEQISILANIARKSDRLANGGETDDETQADTAIDLMLYLVKYRKWLYEAKCLGTPPTENIPVHAINSSLDYLKDQASQSTVKTPHYLTEYIVAAVEELIQNATQHPGRWGSRLMETRDLIVLVWRLASDRWKATQPPVFDAGKLSAQPLVFDTKGLATVRYRYRETAPHSPSCSSVNHHHGSSCSSSCPTCSGREIGDDYRGADHE